MPSTETKIQGDNVSVKIDREPGCQITLEVDVTPNATQVAYKKALKSVNKEVSLPGFRKGRAPDAMIIDGFGNYVEQEWKQILVETAFKEALNLSKLNPFSEGSIKRPEVKESSKENGSKIIFKFESSPEIPEIDLNDIQLKKVEQRAVDKKQIEQSLEEIRLHHAVWEIIEDRAAEESDYVDVDIENLDKDNENICKDARFQIADGKMGKWMRNLIVGLKTNESAEGVSEKEDTDTEAAFIPTKCRITVKGIHKATLPEVDSALAEKVGLKTPDELMERLEAELNKQSGDEVQDKLREQLNALLLEKYPFDLPKSLVEEEMKQRLQQEKTAMGGNLTNEQNSEVEEKVTREVTNAFRLFFLSRKVAEDNDIEVGQEEMLKELMAQMYSPTGQNILASSNEPSEVRSRVYISLLTQKAKDFLIEKSTQS